MKDSHRRAIIIICGAALLAASAPTFAGAVTKLTNVIVRNTSKNPVPAKLVGSSHVTVDNQPSGVAVTNKPSVSVPDGVAVTNKPGVSVPDGVAVTNKPDVSVPDGVALKGTPTVKVDDSTPVRVSAPPERFQQLVTVSNNTYEQCTALTVPSGKQYVVESAHLEGQLPGTAAQTGYIAITERYDGGASVVRFAPSWRAGYSTGNSYTGDIDGPYVASDQHIFNVCVNPNNAGLAAIRAIVVGTVQDA